MFYLLSYRVSVDMRNRVFMIPFQGFMMFGQSFSITVDQQITMGLSRPSTSVLENSLFKLTEKQSYPETYLG